MGTTSNKYYNAILSYTSNIKSHLYNKVYSHFRLSLIPSNPASGAIRSLYFINCTKFCTVVAINPLCSQAQLHCSRDCVICHVSALMRLRNLLMLLRALHWQILLLLIMSPAYVNNRFNGVPSFTFQAFIGNENISRVFIVTGDFFNIFCSNKKSCYYSSFNWFIAFKHQNMLRQNQMMDASDAFL